MHFLSFGYERYEGEKNIGSAGRSRWEKRAGIRNSVKSCTFQSMWHFFPLERKLSRTRSFYGIWISDRWFRNRRFSCDLISKLRSPIFWSLITHTLRVFHRLRSWKYRILWSEISPELCYPFLTQIERRRFKKTVPLCNIREQLMPLSHLGTFLIFFLTEHPVSS